MFEQDEKAAVRQEKMLGAIIGAIALTRTAAGHEPSRKSSRPCRVTIDYRKGETA